MKAKKPNPKRPGRRKKGPHTDLLPTNLQGRHYAVVEFRVQPVVAIYADGEEERRFLSGPGDGRVFVLSVFKSNFKKTLLEIMTTNGVAMEGGKP